MDQVPWAGRWADAGNTEFGGQDLVPALRELTLHPGWRFREEAVLPPAQMLRWLRSDGQRLDR